MTTSAASADELQLLTDSARTFCEKLAPCARIRALRGSPTGFDKKLWREMADLGWMGILAPERVGGLDLGLTALAKVLTELGRVAAPEPLLETAGICVSLLASLPLHVRATDLLEQMVGGELITVLAWQEDPLLPLPSSLKTRGERSAGDLRLSGTKYCVPLAAAVDGYVVSATLDDDFALLWIPADTAGVTRQIQRLADGTHHASVTFENVAIDPTALLAHGPPAAEAFTRALDAGAILSAAYLCGLMSASFEATIKYLNTRTQFGRAIGTFQALQHRAVNLYLQTELAKSTLTEAATEFATSAAYERALLASRAKYRASEAALRVVREAVQMHGAIGVTDECDIGLYLNRALVVAAAMGNATWHCRRVGELVANRSLDQADAAVVNHAETVDPADWNSLSDAAFRHGIRQWFEREYPPHLRYPPRRLRWAEIKPWYLALSVRGWLAPAWPREYGGMGLEPSKLLIFIEEQERWGIARAPDMGITMVGPLLIRHGTAEQRAEYLPKILAGEHIWCQGYSEPNAGSDLASLRTEAIQAGDVFIVNGQKTWTTLAQDATHVFLLARTDKGAKKQAGISFLLVDITTAGITVRPIKNIAGHEEFCEVFFDDVRVPITNVVGALNHGWTIAKALLSFERIFLGSPKQSQYALQRLTELAHHHGLFSDPVFRDRYVRLKFDVLDLETVYARFALQVRRGEPLGPDVSLLKIWATETFARLTELMMETAGSAGAQAGNLTCGEHEVDVLSLFYTARPATIYGGSNEIQRNIIAKSVLGLPD